MQTTFPSEPAMTTILVLEPKPQIRHVPIVVLPSWGEADWTSRDLRDTIRLLDLATYRELARIENLWFGL